MTIETLADIISKRYDKAEAKGKDMQNESWKRFFAGKAEAYNEVMCLLDEMEGYEG